MASLIGSLPFWTISLIFIVCIILLFISMFQRKQKKSIKIASAIGIIVLFGAWASVYLNNVIGFQNISSKIIRSIIIIAFGFVGSIIILSAANPENRRKALAAVIIADLSLIMILLLTLI